MELISVIVLCFVGFTNVYSDFESCAPAERRSLFYSSWVRYHRVLQDTHWGGTVSTYLRLTFNNSSIVHYVSQTRLYLETVLGRATI